MSSYDYKGCLLSDSRTAGGPGDSDVDEFASHDLDSEEHSPDDFESDYFEDELGEYLEDRARDMQDRFEDMLDDFQ